MKLHWKEPPVPKRGRALTAITAEIIAALKARRGKWVQFRGPRASNFASDIARWKKAFPQLEMVQRREAKGAYLYLRYPPNGKRFA